MPLLRNLWDGHPRWGWRAISVKKPMFQGGERHVHVLRGFFSGIFSETILVTFSRVERADCPHLGSTCTGLFASTSPHRAEILQG